MDYRKVTAIDFSYALQLARHANPFISRTLVSHPVKAYEFMDCYLAEDDLSGYAITINNELTSFFSAEKGRGVSMAYDAVHRGATVLHCYDHTIDLFRRVGFVIKEKHISAEGTVRYRMEVFDGWF